MTTRQYNKLAESGDLLILRELKNPQTSVHGDYVVLGTGDYTRLVRDASRWQAIDLQALRLEKDAL